jgi:hypothetical protein
MKRKQINHTRFEWRGTKLFIGGRKAGEIIADEDNAWMWRVRLPDGSLSDLLNMSRARDAAQFIARSEMERSHTAHSPLGHPYSDLREVTATPLADAYEPQGEPA